MVQNFHMIPNIYMEFTSTQTHTVPDVVDTIGEPGSEWLDDFLLNAGLVLIGFTVQVIKQLSL